MASDNHPHPGFKYVYKINTLDSKFPTSKNVPEACVRCLVRRVPGAPPMQICGGCRAVRYCVRHCMTISTNSRTDYSHMQSKEHQKEDWPSHKGHCRIQREYDEGLVAKDLAKGRRGPQQANSLIPTAQERKYLLEDWKELHRMPIAQGLAWALHELPEPFDFHKNCFYFVLKYRPESGGNPASAFDVDMAFMGPAPPPETRAGKTYLNLLPTLERSNAEEKAKGNPRFMSNSTLR